MPLFWNSQVELIVAHRCAVVELEQGGSEGVRASIQACQRLCSHLAHLAHLVNQDDDYQIDNRTDQVSSAEPASEQLDDSRRQFEEDGRQSVPVNSATVDNDKGLGTGGHEFVFGQDSSHLVRREVD